MTKRAKVHCRTCGGSGRTQMQAPSPMATWSPFRIAVDAARLGRPDRAFARTNPRLRDGAALNASTALVPVAGTARSIVLADLVDEMNDYTVAAKSAATRAAYAQDWADFRRWCAAHALNALPATPQAAALCVAHCARRLKVASIRRRRVSISQAHKMRGFDPAPTSVQLVRETMRGISRTLRVAHYRKEPIRIDDLPAILDALPDTLKGVRDRALLLIGFSGAFRRSEIVALNVDDIAFVREGLIVNVRRSKTDQEGAGTEIAIPCSRHPERCPARSLQAWLDRAGIDTGPLFRAIDQGSHLAQDPLTGESIAYIVKTYVARLGFDPARYAAHSLRAGFATAAIEAGARSGMLCDKPGSARRRYSPCTSDTQRFGRVTLEWRSTSDRLHYRAWPAHLRGVPRVSRRISNIACRGRSPASAVEVRPVVKPQKDGGCARRSLPVRRVAPRQPGPLRRPADPGGRLPRRDRRPRATRARGRARRDLVLRDEARRLSPGRHCRGSRGPRRGGPAPLTSALCQLVGSAWHCSSSLWRGRP